MMKKYFSKSTVDSYPCSVMLRIEEHEKLVESYLVNRKIDFLVHPQQSSSS